MEQLKHEKEKEYGRMWVSVACVRKVILSADLDPNLALNMVVVDAYLDLPGCEGGAGWRDVRGRQGRGWGARAVVGGRGWSRYSTKNSFGE